MSRNELVKGPPFFSPLFKFLPLLPNVPNTTGDTIPFLPLSFIREPESLGSTRGSPSGVADFNAPPAKAIEAFCHGLQVDNRDLVRDLPPPICRLVWSRSKSDPPELRPGMEYAPCRRFIYGYVGVIERLRTQSANTTTSFARHVIAKLTRYSEPSGETRHCYARALAYSANFAGPYRATESCISIGDFPQWHISATHSNEHTGGNSQRWKFAEIRE